MRKKKKQKKSLHPPGGELLSAMQVPSDLAFGEPVVTFYGGREVQIEKTLRFTARHTNPHSAFPESLSPLQTHTPFSALE